jgi:hypothetical protein
MALTKEQLEANIRAMADQGAPPQAIQAYLDTLGEQQELPGEKEQPGFWQGLAQEVAKPFLRTSATVAGGLETAARGIVPGGKTAEETAASWIQGTETGMGNIRPWGAEAHDQAKSGEIGLGEFGVRATTQAAGGLAEIASYTLAPLKIGRGFWSTIKEAAPMAATFAAGKAGQAIGEGDSVGRAALEGAGHYVGATVGFGLVKGAGNVVSNFGARALRTSAFKTAASWAKDFAEKVWQVLPEAFQAEAQRGVDWLAGKTAKRSYNALLSEFQQNWKTSSDSVIDSLVPEVNSPDLTFNRFQRTLGESMGNLFRKSNALWDDVKADQTTINSFNSSRGVLGKMPQAIDPNSFPAGPDRARALSEAMSQSRGVLSEFAAEVAPALDQPMTLRQVMGLWERSMAYIPRANNEERALIRDFASSLYADARHQLTTTNKDLLDQWDLAYQAWKKAGDVYESSVLNNLKGTGEVDTFLQKMVGKDLTSAEQRVFLEAVKDNPQAVQDLFINSLLSLAKTEKTAPDGAKLIRSFLDNWDLEDGSNAFLSSEQVKMLDDIAGFMEGSFDDFLEGMRRSTGEVAKQVTPEGAAGLQETGEAVNVLEKATAGRFDEIADWFSKNAGNKDFELAFSNLKPEEQKLAAMSVFKNMFDTELEVAIKNADGTFTVNPEFVKMFSEAWETAQKSPTLLKTFDDGQRTLMESAAEFATAAGDLGHAPENVVKRLLNGVMAAFYLERGWIPGTIRNTINAFKGTENKKFYEAMEKAVELGWVEANTPITIGNFVKKFLPVAGQALDIGATEVVE